MEPRQYAFLGATRRKGRTTPRPRRGSLDPGNLNLQPVRPQRIHHDARLPIADECVRGVLHLTAATTAKMATGRCDTIGGGADNLHLAQPRTVEAPADGFTWQGHGGKNRPRRNAVAVMSKSLNNVFAHGARIQ